ncbi:MAG: hypothetical protein JWM21_3285 [Acidobacteria bacterium]|nr:hypothetical protein [Acidobacteriota bacterium]
MTKYKLAIRTLPVLIISFGIVAGSLLRLGHRACAYGLSGQVRFVTMLVSVKGERLMFKHLMWFGLIVLLITVSGNRTVFSTTESRRYQDTRRLLSAMDNVRTDSDKLAVLFKSEDGHIRDLIHALDDPDGDIRLRAQIVIRYLGSVEGMRALFDWYNKQHNELKIAGPVPLPLSEWDYKFINMNLIGKPLRTWGDLGVQYVYALAVDDSKKSKTVLKTMIKNDRGVEENSFVGYAIKRVQMGQPMRLLPKEKDLAKLVLDNAFFIPTPDQRHASARLLGFNAKKDKALIEVNINRGRLAEEWYHVVISKSEQGWKFFSISPVAVS